MITHAQAWLAKETHADVFTPEGDAGTVEDVYIGAYVVTNTGYGWWYRLDELEPSRGLLALESDNPRNL